MNKENQEWEFIECDTCKVKPGSPTLCAGCLNNRQAISALSKAREEERSRIKEKLNELANDPPIESNERRRGYHQALTDAINVVNSKEIHE